MSTKISYSAALSKLQEMFPNHSPATIEKSLRDARGVMEVAVNKLLAIKPDKGKHSAESSVKKPTMSEKSQHIFPDDYLRWPKNVHYVKVFDETSENTLLDDDDSFLPPPNDGDMPEAPLSIGDFKDHQESAWESLKQQFAQRDNSYKHL